MPILSLMALTLAAALVTQDAGWSRVPELCRQLHAEGWRSPDGDDGGLTELGGALKITLCRLERPLPSAGRGTPPRLEVFLQGRGGRALTVTADIWDERDRQRTLAAAADRFTTLARSLQLMPPPGLAAATAAGEPWEDDAGGLHYRLSRETREEERRIRPDAAADEIPWLRVTITAEPEEH